MGDILIDDEEEQEDEIDLGPQVGTEEDLERIFAESMDRYNDGTQGITLSQGGNSPDGFVLALQEFNWNPRNKRAPHFKGHFFHTDKEAKPGPRAAIFASNNLDIWGVPQFTNRDLATAVWLVKGAPFQKVYIASCYHMDTTSEPDSRRLPVIDPLLDKLFDHCRAEGAQLVLLSDTNAHSVLWHMPRTNTRGKHFEELVMRNHLQVLNKGPLEVNWTWKGLRQGQERNTIIDVTFCTPGIANNISGWRVRNGAPISDHRSTEFVVSLQGQTEVKRRQYSRNSVYTLQMC